MRTACKFARKRIGPTEKEVFMKKNRFPALMLALLCALCLTMPAHADMGPKPDLTIAVVNAPEGETVYVDLLYEASGELYQASFPDGYEPDILEQLHSLENDRWVLACATGTGGAPIFGDIAPQADGTYWFGYFGLPTTFRLAAATASSAQATAEAYTRTRFHTNLVYDWQANTLRAVTPTPVFFLAQLAATLVPTLILEGLVLWLFAFRQKRSWLVFLAVNLVTQAGLHLFCANLVAYAFQSPFYYVMSLLVPELVILVIEAAAYSVFMKEHRPRRRILYALCANIVSFLVGFFPIYWLGTFLSSL